jgi:hypothetical protein
MNTGGLTFVEKVKSELGFKAAHREVKEVTGTYTLREQSEAYGANFAGETEALRPEDISRGRKLMKRLRHSLVQPATRTGIGSFVRSRFFPPKIQLS